MLSCSANAARRMAGRPVSLAIFSKSGTKGRQGSQTELVARACSIETVVMWSRATPAGGVQPELGDDLERPQLSHDSAPFGYSSVAPLGPQLDEWNPMRLTGCSKWIAVE